MKQHLLFAFLLAGMGAQAQTITSVTNGNATNPFTWDCTCVPLPGSTIVINHAVILDNDFAYGAGSVTINAGGSLTGTTSDRIFGLYGGAFTNHGTLNINTLFHSGGTFVNNGTINVTNGFAIGGSAITQNNNTINVSDSLLVDVSATLSNAHIVSAMYTASAGTINNTGSFSGIDLWTSGTVLNNTGVGMEFTNLYTNGNFNNGGSVEVNNDFWNSENVVNTNYIIVHHDLWTGDSIAGSALLTNNGTISVGHDLNNSETMNGNGMYCIANSSLNAGDVNGTLLICDQTGDNFDNNFGTVAGTVTFCTGGACALSVNDVAETVLNVYPNPVSDVLNIEMNNSGHYHVVLVNSLGEVMHQNNFTGNRSSLDLSGLAAGLYLYRISGNGNMASGTVVKQ